MAEGVNPEEGGGGAQVAGIEPSGAIAPAPTVPPTADLVESQVHNSINRPNLHQKAR